MCGWCWRRLQEHTGLEADADFRPRFKRPPRRSCATWSWQVTTPLSNTTKCVRKDSFHLECPPMSLPHGSQSTCHFYGPPLATLPVYLSPIAVSTVFLSIYLSEFTILSLVAWSYSYCFSPQLDDKAHVCRDHVLFVSSCLLIEA